MIFSLLSTNLLLASILPFTIHARPRPQEASTGGDSPLTNPGITTANANMTYDEQAAAVRNHGLYDDTWPTISLPISAMILSDASAYISFTSAGPTQGSTQDKTSVIGMLDAQWNALNAAAEVPNPWAATGPGGVGLDCGGLGARAGKGLILSMLVTLKGQCERKGTHDLAFELWKDQELNLGQCSLKVSGLTG